MVLDSFGNETYPVASGVRYTEFETVTVSGIQNYEDDSTPIYDGDYGNRPQE